MSNLISHNFQQLREIHPWTIFQMLFQKTPVVLSHDAMMYIYDYLVPMHVDLNAPIRIFYEHKNRDTWETTTRCFTIGRFDFIYQLMKACGINTYFIRIPKKLCRFYETINSFSARITFSNPHSPFTFNTSNNVVCFGSRSL